MLIEAPGRMDSTWRDAATLEYRIGFGTHALILTGQTQSTQSSGPQNFWAASKRAAFSIRLARPKAGAFAPLAL